MKEITMSLCKGEERDLVNLLSLMDLGGYGTKKEVLDNIQDKNYLQFTQDDLKLIPAGENSVEPKWRNDLAWDKDKLKKAGLINNSKKNDWRITESGKAYFFTKANFRLKNLEMISRLAKENKISSKLTKNFYERISQLSHEVYGANGSLNSKIGQDNRFVKKNGLVKLRKWKPETNDESLNIKKFPCHYVKEMSKDFNNAPNAKNLRMISNIKEDIGRGIINEDVPGDYFETYTEEFDRTK